MVYIYIYMAAGVMKVSEKQKKINSVRQTKIASQPANQPGSQPASPTQPSPAQPSSTQPSPTQPSPARDLRLGRLLCRVYTGAEKTQGYGTTKNHRQSYGKKKMPAGSARFGSAQFQDGPAQLSSARLFVRSGGIFFSESYGTGSYNAQRQLYLSTRNYK